MNYRQIPRCDFNVSEIGLGCEHLEQKDKSLIEEVIGAALDGGNNIMDVFMPRLVLKSKPLIQLLWSS